MTGMGTTCLWKALEGQESDFLLFPTKRVVGRESVDGGRQQAPGARCTCSLAAARWLLRSGALALLLGAQLTSRVSRVP